MKSQPVEKPQFWIPVTRGLCLVEKILMNGYHQFCFFQGVGCPDVVEFTLLAEGLVI